MALQVSHVHGGARADVMIFASYCVIKAHMPATNQVGNSALAFHVPQQEYGRVRTNLAQSKDIICIIAM